MLLAFAVFAGGLLPFQAGANARLADDLPTRVHGTLVNFLVGGLILLVVTTVVGWKGFSLSRVSAAPWWAWVGGFIGATYVSMGIFVAPKVGTVTLLGAVLVGQVTGSLVVDHFGLVGISPRPVSLARIGGVALLLVGMYLVQRGSADPTAISAQPAQL
jgi:transporter family-2 protein